jgi:hypothetical protein
MRGSSDCALSVSIDYATQRRAAGFSNARKTDKKQ